jgi:hypothetical protein
MILDPYTLGLIAQERQREILRDVERRQQIALARAGREENALFQDTRRLTGAVLIRVGEWVQGARRTDRQVPATLKTPAPAEMSG